MGTDGYFRREYYENGTRMRTSTHFGAGLWNGVPQIRQWVDTNDSAWGWGARPVDVPTDLAKRTLTNLYTSTEDLNWQVIQIEVEGFYTQPWHPGVRDAVRGLLAAIYRAHGNLVVMTHQDVSWKPCPGMPTFQAALPNHYGNRLGNLYGSGGYTLPNTAVPEPEDEFLKRFQQRPNREIVINNDGVAVRKQPIVDPNNRSKYVDYLAKRGKVIPILGVTTGTKIRDSNVWYVFWRENNNTDNPWDGGLRFVHETSAKQRPINSG